MSARFDTNLNCVVLESQGSVCHGCFVAHPFNPAFWSFDRACSRHQGYYPKLLNLSNPNVTGRQKQSLNWRQILAPFSSGNQSNWTSE